MKYVNQTNIENSGLHLSVTPAWNATAAKEGGMRNRYQNNNVAAAASVSAEWDEEEKKESWEEFLPLLQNQQ